MIGWPELEVDVILDEPGTENVGTALEEVIVSEVDVMLKEGGFAAGLEMIVVELSARRKKGAGDA